MGAGEGDWDWDWDWEEAEHHGSKEGNKPNNTLILTYHINIKNVCRVKLKRTIINQSPCCRSS